MSEKSAKYLSFKRAFEGFGGCFERLINEVSGLNERVGVLEEENKNLKKRLEALEIWHLEQMGWLKKTGAFDKRVPDLEAE
jgi:hypothetical protein